MHALVVSAIGLSLTPLKGQRNQRTRRTKGRAGIKCGLIETLENRLRVTFIIILILSQIHAHALFWSLLCCHADKHE